MKLSTIPRTEATIKHSFALKKSTTESLHQYQELYKATHSVEVALKDLVEQMLVDFMGEDKAFQKSLKKLASNASSNSSVVMPATASSPSQDI